MISCQTVAYAQADSTVPNTGSEGTISENGQAPVALAPASQKWITAEAHSPVRIAVSPGKSCTLKVDIGMHRLMASSSAGDSLFSLSLDSATSRPLHYTAFNAMSVDSDDDKIFATTDDQAVMVLDRKSLVRIDRIVLPGHCGAIVYVPSCRRILVAHETNGNIWSIDAKLNTLKDSATVTGPVSDLIYDATTDKVLGLCPSTNQIAVIDPWTMTVTGYWGLGAGSTITSLGVDDGLGLVFCGDNAGTLSVLDCHSGVVLGSVALGEPISSMTYDATAQQIFCLSSEQGEVDVVQLARGGGVINLGQVSIVTGAESAAVIRGSNSSNLWVSYSDQRGSYLQCYTVML
jgi:WD40 repeat protein